MRVLLVHNRYRTSAPSGEDAAVVNEQRMLENRGVEVCLFDRCNDDIDDSSLLAKTAVAANTIWSQRSRRELRAVLRRFKPDVTHVHNTFSMLSPSVYGVCRAEGSAVVQTLHNFRLFCPGALFLRDGKPCEECVDKGLLQSVRHRCYRGSLAATATLASMLTLHRTLGTYVQHIDRYIALTQFAKSKMIRGGIEKAKIAVKPNFLPDPPAAGTGAGGYVAYVGRLLQGKGTETLLAAWRRLPQVKLKIVGDGALRGTLEAEARESRLDVEFTGMLARREVLEVIANAKFLIVPSQWYEGFPMVIAESFACGTPVLASRIGSLQELVPEGVHGGQFTAGDPDDLARRVQSMLGDELALRRMRSNVRNFFEANLSEEQNYAQLMAVYSHVMRAEPPLLRRQG
jgi:glycosyltransferase involved in cell wall biosynthesis